MDLKLHVKSVPVTTNSCEFESRSWQGVLHRTLCDKVCQWHATGGWFSLGTPVYPTNKTDLHDITEISLKVALNTITLMPITIYMHYTEIEVMNVLVFFLSSNERPFRQMNAHRPSLKWFWCNYHTFVYLIE